MKFAMKHYKQIAFTNVRKSSRKMRKSKKSHGKKKKKKITI